MSRARSKRFLFPNSTVVNHDENPLKSARDFWHGGDPLQAGRLIFENLPPEARPAWAAKILRLVLNRSDSDLSHFLRILETADQPRWWANGHRCFDLLRHEVLKLDQIAKREALTKDQEMYGWILSLGELVAKVTYNAVDPPDPFDEDSGWWIATLLRHFVDFWNDAEFSAAAWAELSGERP